MERDVTHRGTCDRAMTSETSVRRADVVKRFGFNTPPQDWRDGASAGALGNRKARTESSPIARQAMQTNGRHETSASQGFAGDPDDNYAECAGAVYVLEHTGATWSQRSYLRASNTQTSGLFGRSAALSDDGLPFDTRAPASGAMFVYEPRD
jgi:hypothetical protein